jgi:DNA-binding response OmpR family regulator
LIFALEGVRTFRVSAPKTPEEKDKKRILVAEDDDSIATMLVRILSVRYEVHRAQDGKQALALADRIRPNLILLDVMMPGLDGYTAAQQIRLLPTLKNVSIIFLTAKGGAMDVVKGIQAGARFYVTKPFKMDDLLAKVRKALGE